MHSFKYLSKIIATQPQEYILNFVIITTALAFDSLQDHFTYIFQNHFMRGFYLSATDIIMLFFFHSMLMWWIMLIDFLNRCALIEQNSNVTECKFGCVVAW